MAPAAAAAVPTQPQGAFILVLRKLATGHSGTVYLAKRNSDSTRYALKQIKRNNKRTENLLRLRANNPAHSSLTGSGEPRKGTEEAKIRREIAIMKKCNHPNVVKLEAFIDDPTHDCVYILMEYMQGGELQWRDRETHRPLLAMDQTRRVMRDVALGIEYLHSQGIIHRDIKPSNIMWSNNRTRVKIGDFGIAALVTDNIQHAGTPSFMAPEIALGGDVTFAVDAWALGVTLFALLFGTLPFEPKDIARTEASLYRAIREDSWVAPPTMTADDLPIADSHRSEGGVLFLLDGLLKKDPTERFDDKRLRTVDWLFADIQQPRWAELHPPLVPPSPSPSPPPIIPEPDPSSASRKRKITVSKTDKAAAIMEPKFKWSLVFGLGAVGRRLNNLFNPAPPSPRETAAPAEGEGRVRSEPEGQGRGQPRSLSFVGVGKGKARAIAPVPRRSVTTEALAGPGATPRSAPPHSHPLPEGGPSAFPTLTVTQRSYSQPGAGLADARAAALAAQAAFEADGTVTPEEQRLLSGEVRVLNLGMSFGSVGEEGEGGLREGTGLIIMPRAVSDEYYDDELEMGSGSGSGSESGSELGYGDDVPPGSGDDEDDDGRRVDIYDETNSDEDAPLEIRRRAR
uniref:Protein kinase domain-containing protein n=1 Tax=Mycena chlorophos TaxID=658473 RepID=A0ABQ0KVY2_MYCCL|nr:predicted protein [Mycena chlorophos]